MKNKKLSVRVILPVVMSVSIAACIITSMMLFSYLFSSYFEKDAVEKVDRQIGSLTQSIEKEISSVNNLVNEIYYQDIKKYDCDNAEFKTIMKQQLSNESDRINSISLYDIDGNTVWSFGDAKTYLLLVNHGLRMRKEILKQSNMEDADLLNHHYQDM